MWIRKVLWRLRLRFLLRRLIRFTPIVLGSVLLIAAVYAVTYYLRVDRGLVWADWTGIEEKKLWDALELLFIPAFLGFGALLLNKFLRDNEQRRTAEQQQEEALRNYFDKMSELIIEKKLLQTIGEADAGISPSEISIYPIMVVARGRTVSILRVLNRDRRNIVLNFIRDAQLAPYILIGADLRNADLRNADLRNFALADANLSQANLEGADLKGASLEGTDLSFADLGGAVLDEDELEKAFLPGSNWEEALLVGKISDLFLEENPEEKDAFYSS